MESTLGVKYDLMLALRSQFWEYLFARNVFQRCLESIYLPSARSGKQLKTNASSYGNPWLFLAVLKARSWWGHILAASARPRTSTKKYGWAIPFRCSWRSVWYRICNIRVYIDSGILGGYTLGRPG